MAGSIVSSNFGGIIQVSRIPEAKWTELFQVQERDAAVLEIREEILAKVMEECDKVFIKRKMTDFLVDCAHEAWKKIIALEFFYHDPIPPCKDNPCCTKDEDSQPCPPDNYAVKNVPIKPLLVEEVDIKEAEENKLNNTPDLSHDSLFSSAFICDNFPAKTSEKSRNKISVKSSKIKPENDSLQKSLSRKSKTLEKKTSEIPRKTDYSKSLVRNKQLPRSGTITRSISNISHFAGIVTKNRKSIPFFNRPRICKNKQNPFENKDEIFKQIRIKDLGQIRLDVLTDKGYSFVSEMKIDSNYKVKMSTDTENTSVIIQNIKKNMIN